MTDRQHDAPSPRPASYADLRDEDLIALVQQGQKRAYDELVRRFKGRLYSFILRMVGDPVEAEELAQETLIRAYIHADKYREIAKFSTWLFTIATNLVRNQVRKRKRQPFMLTLDPAPEDDDRAPLDPADPVADPTRDLEGDELGRLIAEATRQIPEKYRIPFLLREVEELSYEEIQQVTGLKLGTVRSRINRARNRFRANIKPLLKNEALLEELERLEARMDADD
ncbi:MAG TPA: sigma-70 family RNA polymerase sigma factor [Candidatus Krumholzibacteria bacterium]|nr:sigma-70 family RNA polymerase sigma factor [Candidatus Krumholzibacteria bacterium]HRX50703.1 sigma-70 family RNA polymerase sigma factor [Candidatus Krumholzibacteria bacterium]